MLYFCMLQADAYNEMISLHNWHEAPPTHQHTRLTRAAAFNTYWIYTAPHSNTWPFTEKSPDILDFPEIWDSRTCGFRNGFFPNVGFLDIHEWLVIVTTDSKLIIWEAGSNISVFAIIKILVKTMHIIFALKYLFFFF